MEQLLFEDYISVFSEKEEQCQTEYVAGDELSDSDRKHHKRQRLTFSVGKTQNRRDNQSVADYRRKRYQIFVSAQGIGAERPDESCKTAENNIENIGTGKETAYEAADGDPGNGGAGIVGKNSEHFRNSYLKERKADRLKNNAQHGVDCGDKCSLGDETGFSPTVLSCFFMNHFFIPDFLIWLSVTIHSRMIMNTSLKHVSWFAHSIVRLWRPDRTHEQTMGCEATND